jgi:DNA helicase-2/ATP-dependent DNA helicase PcrA
MFYADLHVHSKYSRATSRDLDLEHLAIWGQRKGLSVIGTGDFTHPAWMQEIRDKLVPAEPGLFRLRDDIQREVDEQVEGACRAPVRFMLEVEISTIYRKGEKTRKAHHLIYAPDFGKADRIVAALEKIGNLKSDGRPIQGLDSRDLLEITLDGGKGCYLIPAHIWTPWFSAMDSKSGFDSIDDCYGDLAEQIFAVETGLSSDPAMNWRLSQLDRFTLVSNSDAHSPPKLGREACAFETDLDYWSIRSALQTGDGYAGTVEFFPEESKYHLDGHRKCGVRQTPEESRTTNRCCPECGRELTIGVLNRVDELSDRPTGLFLTIRCRSAVSFRCRKPSLNCAASARRAKQFNQPGTTSLVASGMNCSSSTMRRPKIFELPENRCLPKPSIECEKAKSLQKAATTASTASSASSSRGSYSRSVNPLLLVDAQDLSRPFTPNDRERSDDLH